jgi:hypothetical protein
VSPVTLETTSPSLRRRLDQDVSFEGTGPHEVVLEYVPREYTLALEESIASNLEDEGFKPSNPPITDLSTPLLIQVVPPEVNSLDHRIFR